MNELLDILYALGCKYNISAPDMRTLCNRMGVEYVDLQNHFIGKPAPVTLAN